MHLLQERHWREDHEVRAEALRKERQQMEVEGQAIAEQLTHDASCQKCKLRDLICLSLAEYDTWPLLVFINAACSTCFSSSHLVITTHLWN
jgi:hypothetical protein